jgi:putative nucleotidyltransferase with HDIG domain
MAVSSAGALMLFESLLAREDFETAHHCDRVMRYCGMLARLAALPESDRFVVQNAALLHDIGKIYTPKHLLTRRGPLSEPEMEIVREHPRRGEELLRRFRGIHMEAVAFAVGAHHERIDGTGYPRKLFGTAIPLAARIIAVCDAFDAMTAGRPYAARKTLDDALCELMRCSGKQFDADLVQLFVASPSIWNAQERCPHDAA